MLRSPRIRYRTIMACAVWFTVITPAMTHAGQWVDQRVAAPFRIRSEVSLSNDEGRAIVSHLARAKADVEQTLNIRVSDEPIEVNIFASRASYQRHLSVRVPEGVNRPALYVKGADIGRVYVYRRQGYGTDLRHECTHAVLHNALPYVPMWLDEGLAEYFEVPAAQRVSQHPYFKTVRPRLFAAWQPKLTRLERIRTLDRMTPTDYRDSWAWVHYFLHGPPEVQTIFRSYLADVSKGNPTVPLSKTFSQQVPFSTTRMVHHIRTWK